MTGKAALSCTPHEWTHEIFDLATIVWAFVAAAFIEIVRKTCGYLIMRPVSREIVLFANMLEENVRNDLSYETSSPSRTYLHHMLNETIPRFRLMAKRPDLIRYMSWMSEEEQFKELVRLRYNVDSVPIFEKY